MAGLIGNQYFDLLAAVLSRGSTVIIVAPRSIAADISCTCPLCIFSPICEPISTKHSVSLISKGSGDPTASPKVAIQAVSRGPRHCANEGAVIFGEPKALRKLPKNLPPDPWLNNATHSGPCSSAITLSFFAV